MKLSNIERDFLNQMRKMAYTEKGELVVHATMSKIVRATGRKKIGGIHTHIFKTLQAHGFIQRIKSNKWIINDVQAINTESDKLFELFEYAYKTEDQKLYDMLFDLEQRLQIQINGGR